MSQRVVPSAAAGAWGVVSCSQQRTLLCFVFVWVGGKLVTNKQLDYLEFLYMLE
jgi:hypothetical protein